MQTLGKINGNNEKEGNSEGGRMISTVHTEQAAGCASVSHSPYALPEYTALID